MYYNTKPVNSPHYTDSDNSEEEGLSDYKVNGYHPVHIGEVLLERYIIMQKLGTVISVQHGWRWIPNMVAMLR